MEQSVVRIHDVIKKYGAFAAVDGISFDVARGEVFGFLGPNGSGKTTTIRMLTRVGRADRGDDLGSGQRCGAASGQDPDADRVHVTEVLAVRGHDGR